MKRSLVIATTVVATLSLAQIPSQAAFPGDVVDVAWGVAGTDRRVPQIHRMTFFGTDEQTLTTGAVGAAEPAWSPDGDRIAFVRLGLGAEDDRRSC